MTMSLLIVSALALSTLYGQQPALELRNGWMYSADSGMVTGAFLMIRNRTHLPDTIVSARCDCAEHTEIHTTIRNPDGTMGMRPLDELVVPARQTVVLKPRSLHVMLYHLRRTLAKHDTCTLTLRSKRYGDLHVVLKVR